ncbi:MAG: adenylate/guanylate cyclase domain-containing protein [Solirubrobacteraceae bacterium]
MSGDLAIAFFDVEGYTEFTAEHGDEAGLELAESLLDIASELVDGAGGTVVKRLGDGLMARFDTAQDAVRCATGTQRALQARAALQDDAPVAAAKIGIHVGQVLERDGDIYGNDVNLAARLVEKARGGQILLTEPVVEVLGESAGALDLKRIGSTPRGCATSRGCISCARTRRSWPAPGPWTSGTRACSSSWPGMRRATTWMPSSPPPAPPRPR